MENILVSFIIKLKNIVKSFIYKVPLLVYIKNYFEIKKHLSIFKNKDFNFIYNDNGYKIKFNDTCGYLKENYEPEFFYDYKKNLWNVNVQNLKFFSSINPCFELISELRGYTLIYDIQQGDYIIDAGCSTGFITSFLSLKASDKGKVIAVEPDKIVLDVLKKNININNINNVVVINKAISNCKKNVNFSISNVGSSKIDFNGTCVVETISFNDIIDNFIDDKKKLKFIKMDIEGAEIDIVKDILEFVNNNENTICAIASYHVVNSLPTFVFIEETAKEYSNIFTKTIYPYHTTTFIVNKKNINSYNSLIKFPPYTKAL